MEDKYNLPVELVRVPEAEYELLFSHSEKDALTGCLVHVRFDFGAGGKEHWITTWPHNEERYTKEAIDAIASVIDPLIKTSILRTRGKLAELCWDKPDAEISNQKGYWGFKLEGETYTYYFKFYPQAGDYNMYCYMYETAKLQDYLKNK